VSIFIYNSFRTWENEIIKLLFPERIQEDLLIIQVFNYESSTTKTLIGKKKLF